MYTVISSCPWFIELKPFWSTLVYVCVDPLNSTLEHCCQSSWMWTGHFIAAIDSNCFSITVNLRLRAWYRPPESLRWVCDSLYKAPFFLRTVTQWHLSPTWIELLFWLHLAMPCCWHTVIKGAGVLVAHHLFESCALPEWFCRVCHPGFPSVHPATSQALASGEVAVPDHHSFLLLVCVKSKPSEFSLVIVWLINITARMEAGVVHSLSMLMWNCLTFRLSGVSIRYETGETFSNTV